ncbi:MAG TPA: (E)-4-hydroxy-3-methylbut-2-enyl-diphosphate synthase [Opitutaceae bacterium]|nr:(E)-4-hydroxy-3-methylbut-2-enyl-diphosphate synthase [Opitutaceae bacterium]
MSYCASRFHTIRRRTLEVKVGSVGVGAHNPIRLQSMTTSDTQDVEATVRQSVALAEVGCEIVRVTAPNVQAARCLKDIRAQLSSRGFSHIPLVADIHFLPQAAMEAVEHVEKIRVNPGNYADKKKFNVREYSDSQYNEELERLHEAFSPLVKRCKELGRAMRIGTNHGSLSDRIMNRYGDTPLGMVESALEFLRIAASHSYDQIVLSMKASNPKVMIQAYRLLVERMQQENMHYPLHLGVTEAGDGEDGRIKSAIGIGSLLLDGLGDTIRVSLTEDSVYEVPVARALADKAMSRWTETPVAAAQDSIDPFHFIRRNVVSLAFGAEAVVGPEQPPRVIVRSASATTLANDLRALQAPALRDTPAEGVVVPVKSATEISVVADALRAAPGSMSFIALELDRALSTADVQPILESQGASRLLVRDFSGDDAAALRTWADFARARDAKLACAVSPADLPRLAPEIRSEDDQHLVFTLVQSTAPTAPEHAIGRYRELTEQLRAMGCRAPIWLRNTAATTLKGDASFLSKLLEASVLSGAMLCDGVGDFVSIETEADPVRATKLTYNVLQGAGARISKTEFVACPSCGRTLFDLQTTTQRIRAQTGHLKGVKLAIMGCIVNGPGEMADADFGYVGGAPGKINLYVGKNCVQYNIPQAEADDRLIALIKAHGKWVDPEPVAVS